MSFRASAPARLDFAGGWTDVAPFATEVGGVVVNAAIELRAHAQVELGGNQYRIHSEDPEQQPAPLPGTPTQSGQMDLQLAALRRAKPGPCLLRTRSDTPSGSGLGSSGALGVALVAALDLAQGHSRSPSEQAEAAFQLETVDAALPGGKQDQYAAALGGFHRLVLSDGRVTADRLELDSAFATGLEHHIVVCYTGTSRVSSNTIARVMGAYSRGDTRVRTALHALAEIAERMAEALRAGSLAGVGRLLSANWHQQQELDSEMRTEEMARLEAAMQAVGILGGKAAGAGAGGSMFFIAEDPEAAARAAQQAGARVLPFTWATEGVRQELPL